MEEYAEPKCFTTAGVQQAVASMTRWLSFRACELPGDRPNDQTPIAPSAAVSRFSSRISRSSSGPRDLNRARYLDLLAAAVTHTLYDPPDVQEPPEEVKKAFRAEFVKAGIRFPLPTDLQQRLEGRDRPIFAQTMIGKARLDSLRECVEKVIAEDVPGDLIEAGCWRGGAGIMMRGILQAYEITNRMVWLADSFEGLPRPDAERFPADTGDINYKEDDLAVPLEAVRANFERYGLLDDQVRFTKGWFRDTLPELFDEKWAVVRLDGDLYESTMDGLTNLYPRLSVGGFLILDDFGFPNCREAAEDYRREHGISEPIVPVDWTGAYWRRSG